MQTYYICPSTWQDMDSIKLLSASNLLNNPLANHLLTTTSMPRTSRPALANTDLSRRHLGHYIYLLAFDAQDATPYAKVLKALDAQWEMQACAWLEWLGPGEEEGEKVMEGGKGDKKEEEDEKVNLADMPECVNEKRWRWVEGVKREWRTGVIGRKGHYFIRALDLAPNPIGYAAARVLLARIDDMDEGEPVLVLSKIEHVGLYTELGWRDVGAVAFEGVDVLGERGKTFRLRGFVRDREGRLGGQGGV